MTTPDPERWPILASQRWPQSLSSHVIVLFFPCAHICFTSTNLLFLSFFQVSLSYNETPVILASGSYFRLEGREVDMI